MTTTADRGLCPARASLDNGAVVVAQRTSMTPAVTINAAFKAGSMFDPDHLPGLSYLTGKLLDRGTTNRSASVIAEALDDRGVTLKIATNRHMLYLTCTCLAEDFADVLAIVADAARRPTFPEAEIPPRRSEALTVLRQREDNPASRAVDAVLELLYSPHHPYGRPSKGTADGIGRATRADLEAFHARRIRPSALSLAVVGDIVPQFALDRAAREFDDWNADRAEPVSVPPAPVGAARRRTTIVMPGKSQADIAYALATVRRVDPRYYAHWMMNNVLGQFGLGGRLADNIRERQGMAYYAFSTLDPAAAEAPLLIRAGVDPSNVDRTISAIDHEVDALAKGGPTVGEVEETRAYLIGSIPRMLETNESIATFLQTSEEYGLGLDFDRRLPGLLRDVSVDEVRAAAAGVLDPSRAAIAVAGPEPKTEPE